MARTRKDTPATVATAPPVDFAKVAASARESAPVAGGGRFANNPFVDLLRKSFEADAAGDNGWREVTVSGYYVREIAAALRAATETLAAENVGVRIRYAYTEDDETFTEHGRLKDVTDKEGNVQLGVPEDDRYVTVKFLGRPRRQRSAEDETNGNGSDVDSGDDDQDNPEF